MSMPIPARRGRSEMPEPEDETVTTDEGCRSVAGHQSEHPVGVVVGTRLLIDMDRWCARGFTPDADELLGEMCLGFRLRAAVLPGGRDEKSSVRWAIARQVIEEQAFALRSRFGVREIVDASLVRSLDRLCDVTEHPNEPSIIMTNPARLLRRRPGHLRRLVRGFFDERSHASGSRGPGQPATPMDPDANEVYDFGDGWVAPGSGRRRRRNEVVTLVFREPGDTGRVDIRIVCTERVMRLRFQGIDDRAFEAFWGRWSDPSADGHDHPVTPNPAD